MNHGSKLSYFATVTDIDIFNQIQAQEIKENAQFNLYIDLYDLRDKINKCDNLNKAVLVASLDKLYKDLRLLNEEFITSLIILYFVLINNDETGERKIFSFWTTSKMQRLKLLNHKYIHKHWKLVEALRKKMLRKKH